MVFSHVCHEAFQRVPTPIHVCDMARSCVTQVLLNACHDFVILVNMHTKLLHMLACVKTRIHMSNSTHLRRAHWNQPLPLLFQALFYHRTPRKPRPECASERRREHKERDRGSRRKDAGSKGVCGWRKVRGTTKDGKEIE